MLEEQVDKTLFEQNSKTTSKLAEAKDEIVALNRTLAELQDHHHTVAQKLEELKKKSREAVARNKELQEKISKHKSAKIEVSSGAQSIPITFPERWKGTQPFNGRVQIARGDEEFQFVAALLNANLANHGDKYGTAAGNVHPEGFEVVSVQRIHNAALWRKYCTACRNTSSCLPRWKSLEIVG